MSGKLYIIPIPIAEGDWEKQLPQYNREVIANLRLFAVERIKTARQFLRKIITDFPIDDSEFYEQNKHNDYQFSNEFIQKLIEGQDGAVVSESGYPSVADPGDNIVSKAQENGIEVIPLIGPSSLLLALASSGLNGQLFSFNAYLPIKEPQRSKVIKEFEQETSRTGRTHIFIETPYRNGNLFNDFCRVLNGDIKLCVAYDIMGENQKILTKTVQRWKINGFKFDKTPCVFLIGK